MAELEPIQRIFDNTELKNRSDLANFLGINVNQFSKKKSVDEIPLKWIYKVSLKYSISFDWLMSGKGPKSFDPEDEIHEFPILIEIHRWLKYVKKQMPDTDVNQWLKGELSLNCNTYREWTKRKEQENSQTRTIPKSKTA